MEKISSLMELAAQKIAQLPAEHQSVWKEFARGMETGNEKRVEMALKKITNSDLFSSPSTKEETISVAQILFIALREAYAGPKTPQFEMYTSLLPVFTEFISRNGKLRELQDCPKLLLTAGEQFVLAFFDPQTRQTVYFDNFYEFHFQNIKDYLSSPGFKAWRSQEGIDDFLRACLSRWMVHLGNFTRNRREKVFLNLLDVCLLLLRTVPELLPSYGGLAFILPGARKAFQFLYSGGEDAIDKLLARAKRSSNADLQPTLGEWQTMYNLGSLPEVPRADDSEESPELTVPYVYRTMFEEILGDGSVSPDEEWVIKNMREHLEIPNEKYTKIMDQVQTNRKFQRLAVLNRDFAPRVFLLKILKKTIEDGVITGEEKTIIGKVANALLLNQQTISEVFQEAKQGLQEGKKAGGAEPVSKEMEKLHGLIRYTAMEERIRAVLGIEGGMKVYSKAGKYLAALRPKAQEAGGNKPGDLLAQWPIVAFFYEPQVYLYPIIMLFVDSLDVHPARLEFKGGRIDVEFLQEIKLKAGEDHWVDDHQLIRFYNDGLELEIGVKAVLVGDALQNFKDGCEETKGKFSLMIMHHARRAPILAIQKTGYLDFSGNLAQAKLHISQGKCKEAITLLTMIKKGFPDIHGVFYTIGKAYELMGQKDPGNEENWDKALENYIAEFEVNGTSDKTMRGAARVFVHKRKLDDAVFWLNRAYEIAPASLPNLTALVEVSFQRDQEKQPDFSKIPDYVTRHLGEAYYLFPTHPKLVKLIEELNAHFKTDLVYHFRNQSVSTQFQ